MDVSKPFQALLPTVDSAVLSVLAGSTRPRTGREIARLATRSHPAVQKVLDRLTEHGLVEQRPAGRSFVYTLNRDHLAAPAVEALADMRAGLFGRLRVAVGDWAVQPLHASVFGSTARGDGDAESDIDLFVVRPDNVSPENPTWRQQLEDLGDAVKRWSGNHAGISEVDAADVARLVAENPPIVSDLRADAVELAGEPVRRLLV